jgi:hypothetical protein
MFRIFRVDSLEKLQAQVRQWPEELQNPEVFRGLYQFSFNYAKSAATRFLDIDTAIL